jgi:hypothetical protein
LHFPFTQDLVHLESTYTFTAIFHTRHGEATADTSGHTAGNGDVGGIEPLKERPARGRFSVAAETGEAEDAWIDKRPDITGHVAIKACPVRKQGQKGPVLVDAITTTSLGDVSGAGKIAILLIHNFFGTVVAAPAFGAILGCREDVPGCRACCHALAVGVIRGTVDLCL